MPSSLELCTETLPSLGLGTTKIDATGSTVRFPATMPTSQSGAGNDRSQPSELVVSCWPAGVQSPIEEKSLQEIGDLAAAIWRSQHDDAAKLRRPMFCKVDLHQKPTHRMADEVDRSLVQVGKTSDRRMNVVGERVEGLFPAGVVEVEGCETGPAKGAFQCPQGSRRPRDAVEQNHSRQTRVRRLFTQRLVPEPPPFR